MDQEVKGSGAWEGAVGRPTVAREREEVREGMVCLLEKAQCSNRRVLTFSKIL